MKLFIGTSGFNYKHWRGVFYPEGLPQSKWLKFYSSSFTTVELNTTFYRLPTESSFVGWWEEVPKGFLFSVKVSRFITHIKRLKEAQEPLKNFLSRALLLKEKLGPLLYQLPPGMSLDLERLENFLKLLSPNLKQVFEFRNPSWLKEEVFDLLKSYNIGFCIYDIPGFTTPIVATSGFAYIRFHGSQWLYSSCYSEEELKGWAERIRGLPVAEVYIYFNNDAQGYAVKNALALARLLNK